jgi:choline dehydrogenase-like flavoprotein
VVEAGGENSNKEWRVSGDRWISRMNPELSYHYTTVPQKHADNREIAYDRGCGLGGSSAINFCCYHIGPKDDHNENARLNGDDHWKWDNVKEKYKSIEMYHGFVPEVPSGVERYLNPRFEDDGKNGPLHIGTPSPWETSLTYKMDIWAQSGYKLRSDLNDGEGLGLAVCPSSAYGGVRTTAADMIVHGPSNLHIVTNSPIHRVLFDGKRAADVVAIDGKTYYANQEVILSAGALDAPKLLMHSGIGPQDQLSKFDIPILHTNTSVGQNLVDHLHCSPTWERFPFAESAARVAWYRSSPEEKAAALRQWHVDGTGPLADICTNNAIGCFKASTV